MIVKLDLTSATIAQQVLDIQIPAYPVEADLIGFDGIPQLSETIEAIMAVDEQFYGYHVDGQLVGVIAICLEDDVRWISRLVVDSGFFRQRIATKLLQFVLERKLESESILVSTGTKNTPAIRLYQQMGFVERSMREVAPDVFITIFEYRGAAARGSII